MRFKSPKDFLSLTHKSVTLFGMSGVGKTTIAEILQRDHWFQYSVDYRIGTRYMDEYITDNFKREAMTVPFLKDLLMSDSIYIRSNISFDNLAPLSTYLGKPGNPALAGLTFAEYQRRQAQHREAEIRALQDVPDFIRRSQEIYGYQHFICDTGGSLCEVVNPDDATDPVLLALTGSSALIYIEGTPEHAKTLVERFRKNPKPMYYQPEFLIRKWAEYKATNSISRDEAVDPDAFAVWGFEQLLLHRIPLYEKIARQFGYTISMRDVAALKTESDVMDLFTKTFSRA
jgi:hypothetical protein